MTEKPMDPLETLMGIANDITKAADADGVTHIRASGSTRNLRAIIAALKAERARTKRVAAEMREAIANEGLMFPWNVVNNWADNLDSEGK